MQSEGLIKTEKDLDKIVFPDPNDGCFYDDAKCFIDRYGDSDLALFAGFRTGMISTIFSMGMMGFSMALYDNRKFLDTVLDQFCLWTQTVLERLQSIGFDFFMSYDDIAFNSGTLFSLQTLNEVFVPKVKEVVSVIKTLWVYHSDGDLTKVMDDLVDLGPVAINPFQPNVMDIKAMKNQYGNRICVWGNIDLRYTLTRGTPEEVETEVKQRIKECGPGGGYIISSANSITDYCKLDNVLAMLKAIEKYRDYPISVD